MSDMIFRAASRYPVDPRAVFILALSVFSGATALAITAGPESLEALLPRWGVIVWGVLLCLGSLATLIGMAFQTVWGVIVEQVGSVMVGVTAVFYAGLSLYTLGLSVAQTTGIILAWGLACFIRWAQLQVLIHSAIKRKQKDLIVKKLADELEERYGREKAERMARSQVK